MPLNNFFDQIASGILQGDLPVYSGNFRWNIIDALKAKFPFTVKMLGATVVESWGAGFAVRDGWKYSDFSEMLRPFCVYVRDQLVQHELKLDYLPELMDFEVGRFEALRRQNSSSQVKQAWQCWMDGQPASMEAAPGVQFWFGSFDLKDLISMLDSPSLAGPMFKLVRGEFGYRIRHDRSQSMEWSSLEALEGRYLQALLGSPSLVHWREALELQGLPIDISAAGILTKWLEQGVVEPRLV